MAYATVKWEDAKGGVTSTKVEGVDTALAINTLAAALKAYSNAVFTGTRVEDPNETPGVPADAEHRTVKTKCIVIMREDTGRIVKVSIPAPLESIYTYDSGKRVLAGTNGADITTAVATASGKSLTYVKARHHSDPGK